MILYVAPGIFFDTETWLVRDVVASEEHQDLIKPGDRLLRVGEVRHQDIRSSLTVRPFAGYRAGDPVPITLLRDGQERSVTWPIRTTSTRRGSTRW